MKKIFGILTTFLGIGLLICLIYGFIHPIPPQAALYGKNAYKLCEGFGYFLNYLPGLVFSGFIVSFAVYFGHNSENSVMRFSAAMVGRLKQVMISALICVFVLTLANETLGIFIKQKKTEIINRPGLINQYIEVAESLYNQGFNKRAKDYAQAALKLDPKSKKAGDLYNLTEYEIKTSNVQTSVFENNAVPVHENPSSLVFDSEQVSKVYEYLVKSREAFEKENWFDAHYYAQQGLLFVTAKDPNEAELKQLSVKAWNNLTEFHNNSKTKKQLDFQEKYRGYVALVEKDDLKAYYIFKNLSLKSPEGARDPDVLFYLDIAERRVQEKSFFIDETLELENFEEENNVYFSYSYPNGSKDIWFFKGVSTVVSSGLSIQYLRDFYIVSFNKKGDWEKTMHVPYAKVMPVSTDILDEAVKLSLGIDEKIKTVPYILFKSVGRSDSTQFYEAEYTVAEGKSIVKTDYMLFPLDFEDFLKLEKSSGDPEAIPLLTLYNLAFKSKDYGFSLEVYGQIVVNRLLYPLFVLVLLLFFATFAWNNRIGQTQYFKFSWLLSFPILIVALTLTYNLSLFIFHLLNYTLLAAIGGKGALFAGIGIYIFFMILAIINFLARRSK